MIGGSDGRSGVVMSCDADHDAVDAGPHRRRADTGFLMLIASVSVLSGAFIYYMPGSNPYARLVSAAAEPAPAYHAGAQAVAAMPELQPQPSNPDLTAASPRQADSRAELNRVMIVDVTDAARLPDTAPAPVPTIAQDDDATLVVASVAADDPAPEPFVTPPEIRGPRVLAAPVFTLPAPLAPVRDRLSDPFGNAATEPGLPPFTAPAAPAQPRIAATELTEEALGLERGQRIEVQRRLALAGFDPRGVDGSFGPNTRSAIADFEAAWGFPATGYLEDAVFADLHQRTEAAYQAMRRRAAARPDAAPELASALPVERPDRDGKCARSADGRIIAHQNLGCDIAGLAQQFGSKNQSSLDSEDGPGTER